MKYTPIIIIVFLSISTTAWSGARDETPHYNVVAEYIRSLGAIHNIQQTASLELQESTNTDNPNECNILCSMYDSTRVMCSLSDCISDIKKMHLNKPFDTLITNTITFYNQKLEIHNILVSIEKRFISRMRKYDSYHSDITDLAEELRDSLQCIDKRIYESMLTVFALLIDEKPDSKGHMNHLNITRVQKQHLIDSIDALFGDSLNKEKKDWNVSSAALLKTYLLKDFKCIDEWQKQNLP